MANFANNRKKAVFFYTREEKSSSRDFYEKAYFQIRKSLQPHSKLKKATAKLAMHIIYKNPICQLILQRTGAIFSRTSKWYVHSPVPTRWFPPAKLRLECPSPWPLLVHEPSPQQCTRCHQGLLATTHLHTCPRWSIGTLDRERLSCRRHRIFYEPRIHWSCLKWCDYLYRSGCLIDWWFRRWSLKISWL